MTSSMLQKSIIVKYKLTLPNAKKPTLATPGSAGYDAYSCQDVVILPGECKQIDIGIAIEMPEGIMLQLHNRSSIGKRMINLQCGIIDSDYRGSISVILANYGREPFSVSTGDRIAQAIFREYKQIDFVYSEELTETVRGHGGFGSTGK